MRSPYLDDNYSSYIHVGTYIHVCVRMCMCVHVLITLFKHRRHMNILLAKALRYTYTFHIVFEVYPLRVVLHVHVCTYVRIYIAEFPLHNCCLLCKYPDNIFCNMPQLLLTGSYHQSQYCRPGIWQEISFTRYIMSDSALNVDVHTYLGYKGKKCRWSLR